MQRDTHKTLEHPRAHDTMHQGASRARETTAALARGPREYLVAVRRAGQFVGEMAAFASAAQRCASVVARGPVRALVVPGDALRACVERVPEARPARANCICRIYADQGVHLKHDRALASTWLCFVFYADRKSLT